jgi:hypothetical protein
MSKRVTLTDFEIEQLINGLTTLRNETGFQHEVIKVGQRWYDALITKLSKDSPAPENDGKGL